MRIPPKRRVDVTRCHICIGHDGIILYQLITGVTPFASSSIHETISRMKKCKPVFPDFFDKDAEDLVSKLCIRAVSKIREYLLQKIYQFRKPLSNHHIPQSAMVKHK